MPPAARGCHGQGRLYFPSGPVNGDPPMSRVALLVLLACAIAGPAPAEEFQNPKANIPPKASPQRRQAGEGAPPLPLPATPLRRSEKKREPSPPALVGSLTFSETAQKKAGV